ncbi:MAG: hypothetical protein AAFY26_27895 [Cyanobacteria bacterium J06638_22]
MQQPVQLVRGQDNRIVEALLVDLTQSHLDAFDTLWLTLPAIAFQSSGVSTFLKTPRTSS